MYRRKGRDNLDKYIVTGMTCSACQAHVEKAVSKLEGVDKVSVSLLTNEMTVDGSASSSDIIEAVEKAGYGASLGGEKKIGVNLAEEKEQSLKDNETPKLVKRLIWSVGFLLALMYITMGHNMLSWPLPSFLNHNHIGLAIIEMLIAIIVMEINKAFFVSGFRSLIHMAPNMDTLVAMGSGVSFGWSLYILMKMTYLYTTGTPNMELMNLYHNQLYFESAAMIPALITVGKTLESFSKGKTTNALKNLIKMAPKTASILENGEIIDKPIEEVKPGDIFVVKAGDSIPVDGIIIEGSSAVDESALTGESVPVDKNVNDEVSAATISSSGYFKARAVRTGEDTTFSQIIKMVSDAAGTKAPIARIADKVSGVFVPGVMIIALLVIIYYIISGNNISWALERGIAVLVISCPCALGLATPVAIMVGNGMGAKNGILFKTGEALETLGKTDIIALDKTGTITEGRADVTDIWTAPGINKDELMAMAFSLEKMSEHPLATAIVGYGENHGTQELKVDDYKVLAGNGLKGTINGNTIYGGSAAFIGTKAIVDKKTSDIISKFSGEGKTPLLFAKECNLLGIIAVADTIKEDSKSAIKQLENMGIEVYMLTGDNEQTARAIGKSAGIENVIAAIRVNPNWNYVNLGMGNSLYLNDTFTAYAVEQMRDKHPFTAWKDTLSHPKKVITHKSEPGFCNKFRQIQTKELIEQMCEHITAKNLEAVQADMFKVIPPFLSYKQEANIDRTYFISDEIEANCYIQHEDFRRILLRICTAFLSWNDFERGKALRDKYGEFDSMWTFLGGALTAFESLTIEYIGEGTHDVIVCMLYRFFEGRRDESVAKELGLLGEE